MPAPNQSERDLWNAAPGRLWADRQGLLDRLQSNVLARLMDAARPAPGEAVLDIGCGAGATTLAAARAVGPGAASSASTSPNRSPPAPARRSPAPRTPE
ncbi:hypothetical protein [Pseudooceanicola nanhaiensis]|uniref:hypothetical protein n=1 Tax=Pseudooceanicola nanhaiensis TaxID=375761 RepID=UPI003510D96E